MLRRVGHPVAKYRTSVLLVNQAYHLFVPLEGVLDAMDGTLLVMGYVENLIRLIDPLNIHRTLLNVKRRTGHLRSSLLCSCVTPVRAFVSCALGSLVIR